MAKGVWDVFVFDGHEVAKEVDFIRIDVEFLKDDSAMDMGHAEDGEGVVYYVLG